MAIAVRDRFNSQKDLHCVPDDNAAAVQGKVNHDAELAPADLSDCGAPNTVGTVGILAEPVQVGLQLDITRHAVEAQIAVDDEAFAPRVHCLRAVRHGGVLLGVQKGCRSNVVVTLLVAGIDGGHVDVGHHV